MEQQDQKIYEIITREYGCTTRLKGSLYLKEAVRLVLDNPRIPTMEIYQTLGRRHQIRPSSLENSIRIAVTVSYEENELNQMFPYSWGKPSNSEVIWTIAEYVRCGRLDEAALS